MALDYQELMKIIKDKNYIRFRMVEYALGHGIKKTAREFHTTPKTVRKWVNRYKDGGYKNIKEVSRAPHNPANRITPEQRQEVIKLKKQHPSWGAQRMKKQENLAISTKAILKIFREEKLIKPRRKKVIKRNDLRAMKAKWKVFEQIEVDVKYLDDIPEYWLFMKLHNLPTFQYTARDVVTGLMFLGYAREHTLNMATLFVEMVIKHIQNHGFDLNGLRIQTDNGSEFIGSWNARHDSAFTKKVHSLGMQHHTIPPAAHTWQADVETVHQTIEEELFACEAFNGKNVFLSKVYSYSLYYNTTRLISTKGYRSPLDVLLARIPDANPAVAKFVPPMLDDIFYSDLQSKHQGGYDVIPHTFMPLPAGICAKLIPKSSANHME